MVSVRNRILILILCVVFFLAGCGRSDEIDLSKEADDDFVTASIHLVWENKQNNLFRARSLASTIDPDSLKYINVSVYDENDNPLSVYDENDNPIGRKQQFEYKDHQGTVRVKAGPNRTFVVEGKLPSGYIVFRGENSLKLEPGTRPKVVVPMNPDNERPQNPNLLGPPNTQSRLVTFKISSTDNCGITGYFISEISDSDPRLIDTNWPYLSDPNWNKIDPSKQTEKKDKKIYEDDIKFTLSEGIGTKTVCLVFRDGVGNISDKVSYSIEYKSSDIPGITVHPTTGLITTEAGGTASFSVVLDTQPTADVTIEITGSDETEGNVDPNSVDPNNCIIFTPDNWNITQNITIKGENDDTADGDVGYTINLETAISADPQYSGLDPEDVSIINQDDEPSPGITVSPTSGLVTTEAGGTASFSVVLDMLPESDVTIKITSNDETEGKVDPNSVDPNNCIIFTPDNWNIARNITITGVDDDMADGDIEYQINIEASISADTKYNGMVPDPNYISLLNWDNEGSSFEPDLNTVALWHLNIDGIDASGNGNDLEVKEERISWVQGKYGKAIEIGTDSWSGDCSNLNGYALVARDDDCSYPGNGDWTVEAWVKFPSISASYAIVRNLAVYYCHEDMVGVESYYLEISNGMAIFQIQGYSSEIVSVDISDYANQWIHIAGVYHYQKDLELYINKHLTGHVDTFQIPDTCNDYYIYLGESYCGTSTGLKIDEVRISNIARYSDTDTDNDGMPDFWEISNNLDPNNPDDADEDPDIDKLINLEEYNNRTNPFNNDTDEDGYNDGDEVLSGSNPNDPNDFHIPKRHYVDIDAKGNEDGTSWINAYKNLQDALAVAVRGDELWVAEGVYKPDKGIGIAPGDRNASFNLKNSVSVYGGFVGNETSIDQRDWLLYQTILSGDLNGDDDPNFSNNDENSYHVVFGNDSDETAVLDGFVITSGNANGFDPADKGGGVYNYHGNPTIKNCTFSENYANRGGGIYNDYSSPAINNCTFRGNSANDAGGGIYNYYKSPIIDNCSFSKNIARVGAGICNYSSNSEIANSTFNANFASSSGGGMYSTFTYSPPGNIWVSNCTFINNFAELYGGGMDNSSGCDAIVENCNFQSNNAEFGGGMMNSSESNIKVENSNFYHNSASLRGGGMYNSNNAPILNNCQFIQNTSDEKGGGIYHTITYSTITNCIFSKNTANYAGGVYIDGSDSENEIINCTFYGNSVTGGAGGLLNMSSNISLINCVLWGNTAVSYGPQIGIIGGTMSITYCDIKGGKDEIYQSDIITWGVGNIDVDPLFVDPNVEDYHLQPGSPCFNAGDPNSAPPNFPDNDIDDEMRPYRSRYDMGADELTLLPPPKNINTFPGDRSITIIWDEVSPATNYNIYVSYSNDVSKEKNEFFIKNVNTTYHTFTGLTNGIDYYFVITSKNSLEEESYESKMIGATPDAQQNYYIFPEKGTDAAPTDVMIIGKDFQETTTVSIYGGSLYIKGSCDTLASYEYFYDVYVAGNYAYVAGSRQYDSNSRNYNSFFVIDISNPNSPAIIGSFDTGSDASDVYVAENYAYVTDSSGLDIIDISNPKSPTITGYYDTTYTNDVYVSGNYSYVACSSYGLKIIDISNPKSPTITGICNPYNNSDQGVYVAGNYAYVADYYSGLRVIDISNPNSPAITGSCNMEDVRSVYVLGNYAYVAGQREYYYENYSGKYKSFYVIDISNPKSSTIIGFCDTQNVAYDVYVAGNYAYVAVKGGIKIIDISNPNSPAITGSCNMEDVRSVYVAGNYIYVTAGSSGLKLVVKKYKTLTDITYLSPYIIEATIPADRPDTYDLHITNPDGEHTIVNSIFTIQ